MAQISESPFEWLQFDQNGGLATPAVPGALSAALASSGAADLVIISHGWKTDQAGAGALYTPLWANVTASLKAAGTIDPAKVVVGGVIWPSVQFQTDFDVANMTPVPVGTALGLGGMTTVQDLDSDGLNAVIDQFVALVGPSAEAVRAPALANQNGFSPPSAKALLTALRSAVSLTASFDAELTDEAARLSDDPMSLLQKLDSAPLLNVAPDAGGALSLISAVQGALEGPAAAVGRLLNQFTYFEMKNRAGVVGAQLGGSVLSKMAPAVPVRLHLVGHSFGGRLVTAAAAAFRDSPNLRLRSLTLLQGAFSHNALSAGFGNGEVGVYADVLASKKIGGPITITHTHNDSACTIAYALASRLSNDTTKALGDKNDPFGAMGANGAQQLDVKAWQDAGPLTKGKTGYALNPDLVNNVAADACISEHMDVTNADVGALVASVLVT